MSEFVRNSYDPIDEAQCMSEWFSDYMYGLTSDIGFVPTIVKDRMNDLFGPDASPEDAMPQLRALVLEFADDVEDQTNSVLYVCGYPDDMIERLGMGDTASTIRKIESRFTKEDDEQLTGPSIATPIAQGLAKPAVRDTVISPKLPMVTPAANKIAKPAVQQTVKPPLAKIKYQPTSAAPVQRVELGEGSLTSVDDLVREAEGEKWQDRGLCAQTDPDAFFPEKGGSTREAKRICQGCEVKTECLEYALDNDERFGIWGGLSERERRRLKRGQFTVDEALAEADTRLEARLIAKREMAKRIEQLFSIVCQEDERDEEFEAEVSYDDELWEQLVATVFDKLYRQGLKNPDEERIGNLRRYFTVQTFEGENAQWYIDNETRLAKDLRGMDFVMQGIHQQYAAIQKEADLDEQPDILQMCQGLMANKLAS